MSFDESVDRLFEKFRGPMFLVVPLGIITCVLQAKVGAEVDHLDTSRYELGDVTLTFTMRECEKRHVNLRTQDCLSTLKREFRIQRRQRWRVPCDAFAGVGIASCDANLDVGVRRQESQ